MELFTTVDVIGQGLPLLMPKGAKMIQKMQRWIEDLDGILIAEQGGSLAVTQGQIPIGMLRRLIHIILEGTGHGTEGKHFLIRFV